MDKSELVESFVSREETARQGYAAMLSDFPNRKSTVGKHEAKNYIHLSNVLEEADVSCPRAADTIRWMLWHNVVDAQWYMHMAEMIETVGDSKERSE